MPRTTRLFSWNVNGLRSILRQGTLLELIDQHAPDILCLQEVRATPEQAPLELDGYRVLWNAGRRKGYSGTAVLTRIDPLHHGAGLMDGEPDLEGRVQTLEFHDYFLVNVYTPNAQRELTRLGYRHKEWDPRFHEYLLHLQQAKPVVCCGDFNVAHREIDLARPRQNVGNAGFTPEEREGFERYVQAGFIDTFREFCAEPGHYTWWSWQSRARERNIGWRIDYFLISPALRPRLKAARIHAEVMGSDHCPVSIELR